VDELSQGREVGLGAGEVGNWGWGCGKLLKGGIRRREGVGCDVREILVEGQSLGRGNCVG
jgi:hypothetical protein